jgi:hypothetical protein
MFPCNVEAGQSLITRGAKVAVSWRRSADRTDRALFPPCGPPTRWGEHRRERLARFHEPALLSRILLSRVEFVQSRLNGNTSDRGICDRFWGRGNIEKLTAERATSRRGQRAAPWVTHRCRPNFAAVDTNHRRTYAVNASGFTSRSAIVVSSMSASFSSSRLSSRQSWSSQSFN